MGGLGLAWFGLARFGFVLGDWSNLEYLHFDEGRMSMGMDGMYKWHGRITPGWAGLASSSGFPFGKGRDRVEC